MPLNPFQIFFRIFFEAAGISKFRRISYVSVNFASVLFWYFLFVVIVFDITRIVAHMANQVEQIPSLAALNNSDLDIYFSNSDTNISDLIRLERVSEFLPKPLLSANFLPEGSYGSHYCAIIFQNYFDLTRTLSHLLVEETETESVRFRRL